MKNVKFLATALALVLSPQAFAGDFYTTFGASHADVDSDTSASSEFAPQVGIGYQFNDRLSFELNGNPGAFDHEFRAGGATVATVDVKYLDASVLYHFDTKSRFDPYVGIGATHADFDDVNFPGFGSLGVSVASDTGPMARVGVDYDFSNQWFARLDVSYADIDTRVRFAGVSSPAVDIDPVRVSLLAGYKF